MATQPRHSRAGGNPVTDNLDVWTSALLTKSTAGRGSNGRLEAYGIKRLRELILELAVRGKLLPQGDKWEQTCLGELGDWAVGSGFPKNAQGSEGLEILFAKVSDMNSPENTKFIVTTNHTISEATATELRVNIHVPGTVIFPKIGGAIATNKRRILTRPTAIDNNCLGITPKDGVTSDWLYLVLSSIDFAKYQAGTSVPALSQGTLAKISVSLPGQAEQHRIVAKVDELMALCDQLEQQQTDSIAAHQTLVATLLGTLTRVESQQEFSAAWARIASHFDTLFTTEASIGQLKQTLLQLAVMGKLVPQDPNDEPVAILLERVSEIKAGLAKEGKIQNQKGLSIKEQQSTSNQLPSNWRLVCLGDLVSVMDAGWSPACQPEPSPNDEVWGVLKTTAVQVMQYLQEENKALPHNKEQKPQYAVKAGDILITRAGPKNRVAISCLVETTRPKLMISDKIIRLHLVEAGIYERYISLCLNAGVTAEYLEASKSGMAESQMNISQDKLRLAPIPLCPINEQHRIVAKVDELMALCDALKARLADAQTTQLHLADAIVEQAVC
ncbi:MAG: restriction endonuclease subunit S [Betaproteobacteria bacterium]|nr:restriction endonuclease subunit S [Betaproteobacteria bacterium]